MGVEVASSGASLGRLEKRPFRALGQAPFASKSRGYLSLWAARVRSNAVVDVPPIAHAIICTSLPDLLPQVSRRARWLDGATVVPNSSNP